MSTKVVSRPAFASFAALMAYPSPDLAAVARQCEQVVAANTPEAGKLLREFRVFVEEASVGQLEEVYTGLFDLDATCYPYVGYHLFGESYKRSVFLLELKERYRANDFAIEGELPDHLAVLLRFLAVLDDPNLASELIHEAMLPALDQMIKQHPEEENAPVTSRGSHAYLRMLVALRLVLLGYPCLGAAESTATGIVDEDGVGSTSGGPSHA